MKKVIPMKVRRSYLLRAIKQLELDGEQNTEKYKTISELCKIKKADFIIEDMK